MLQFVQMPELLRDPTKAGWLFYIGMIAAVYVVIKNWLVVLATLAGVVALGFVVRLVAGGIWDTATTGEANDAFVSRIVDDWVLILESNQDTVAAYAFVAAVVGVLAVVELRGPWRPVCRSGW